MKKILLSAILTLAFCANGASAIDLPDLPKNQENVAKQAQQAVQQNAPAIQAAQLYDLGTTYDDAIKQDKPVVLLFYTSWCSACKRALPLVKAQQEKYGNDFVFTSLNAEDTNYSTTIKDYRLRCFPTVYIIDPKYDNRVHIEVSYLFNAEAFSKELNRYLAIRKILDSAPKAEQN